MKVRIGVGVSASSPDDLAVILAGVAELGFDSIWLPELLTGGTLDPTVALTWAAAKYPRMKLGTTMLLPGRNLIRLAKQLATLDSLSDGRLLVTFVPGINQGAEASAIGVAREHRRAAMEEALPLLRALLDGQSVSHDGPLGSFTDVRLTLRPVQRPLEFWLGGTAPRSLDLCGRLGDGWLPSLLTPEQASAGKGRVESAAAEAGRRIDPEHFGVSIGYSREPLNADTATRLAARGRGGDLARLVPIGPESLRRLVEEFIEAGFSKFVVRSMGPSAGATSAVWINELAALGEAVLAWQT